MPTCPACRKELPGEFPYCPFCAAPLVGAIAAPIAIERKVVSVMFCDLVGFTAAGEHADPEEVRARLGPYHTCARQRIEAFGGTVEKFIGDAVMAVFGAPVAHEDDAERAVRAALSVLEGLEELNDGDESLALSVRVGVNTGEVIVALDVRPELGEGVVTGDVVNTAARIQSQAPIDGVAVGRATFQATERVFEFEPLQAIAAKGKSEPVHVWRVIAARARLGSDILRSHATPLVGREAELDLLTRTFDRVVQERKVQLVTVVGEPGVGKSRLIAELGSYIDKLPGLVTWRQGRCLPYGQGISFWALGEILKAHAGIYESDSPEIASAKLDATLPAGEGRPWLRARLLPLLGLAAGETAVREELFAAWRRYLDSIAERDPLVVVVEDIHWADEAMLAFLEHLAEVPRDVALLIVATARPELQETRPEWGKRPVDQISIRLSPLSDGDTTTLVSALLDRALLPPETQRLLLERAGGNPLYAEEFVRMLRDRNLLDQDGGLRGETDVTVPDSVQAVIAARLDTLPRARKRLLQDAAVMGKVFWAGSSVAMGVREANDVELALQDLARRGLVRKARQSSMEGESEYGFWHMLVRDVAYAQIPRPDRAAKHLAAAGWLEAKAGERVEDIAEVLAYHTSEALSLARASRNTVLEATAGPAAARFALLAGERALGLDTGQAFGLLERARALTPQTDANFPLVLLRWAEAARNANRLREAIEPLEQAIAGFEADGDVRRGGEALSLLSIVRGRLGESDWLALGERAVAQLEAGEGPELIAALADLAHGHWAYMQGGVFATAERALNLAERFGLPTPAKALGLRGLARCDQGDLGGLRDCERALELLIAAGKGRDAAVLQHNLALVRWLLEGPQPALDEYAQAEAFASARGLAEAAQASAAGSLVALVQAGRLEQALHLADAILPALHESGDLLTESETLAAQAVALVERGVNAREPAEAALRLLPTDDPHALMLPLWGAALARLAVGDTGAAREALDQVADGPNHDSPVYALVLPALTRVALALGDSDLSCRLAENSSATLPIQGHALAAVEAIQAELRGEHVRAAGLYRDSAERWQAFTCVLEQAHAVLGQGRCLAASDNARAHEVLGEARRLFDQMGAQARVGECVAIQQTTLS